MDILLLTFKITNWCNLECKNCVGHSNSSVNSQLMDINLIKKYISEFKQLKYYTSKFIGLRGGEITAPYYIGDYEYLPRCLDVICKNDMEPIIQTNGLWGHDKKLRKTILNDLFSVCCKKNKVLPGVEIALSGIYDNVSNVSLILSELMLNPDWRYSIPIYTTGHEVSDKSLMAQRDLFLALCRRGLRFRLLDDNCVEIYDSLQNFTWLQCGFMPKVQVSPHGYPVEVGCPWDNENILEIDNLDNATLNGRYRTKIQNRPLEAVVAELKARAK